jgi:hypothetical protein
MMAFSYFICCTNLETKLSEHFKVPHSIYVYVKQLECQISKLKKENYNEGDKVMRQLINELRNKAMRYCNLMDVNGNSYGQSKKFDEELFARLLIHECLNIIEQYPIPVGNSAAGELAAEWTYTALEQICDTIKETFEIKDESI